MGKQFTSSGDTSTPSDDASTLSRRRLLRSMVAGAALVPAAAAFGACEGSRSGGDSADGDSERARTLVLDCHSGRLEAPKLYNPFVPGFKDDAGFQQALIEPLFILNYQTGEIEPWLGDKFEPNDAMDQWTLTIKDGVKWADGEAYDADDVVFTVNLLLANPTFNFAASMQQWVASVDKTDARTVVFKLKEPNPRFQLDYFSVKAYNSIVIVPEHVWRGKNAQKFTNYDPDKNWPLGTGPYQLVSTSATRVVWKRRDDWWGVDAKFMDLPEPERLEWVVNETEDVRVAKAADHQIDSIADMTAGAFESLQSRNDKIISWLPDKPWAWPDPCTRLLSVNNAIEPWSDRDMRWALNYAIDREEVAKIAYEGTTTPAKFFFPNYPAMQEWVKILEDEGLFEKYPILTHDADKAAELIESKGYKRSGKGYYKKGGKELRLQIDAPTEYVEIWRYAQVVGEQLQRVGINATVRKLNSSTWGDNIAMGKFEAASDWSACGSVTEPWSSMSLFTADRVVKVGKRANSNSQRWRNVTYTKAVQSMAEMAPDDPAMKKPFVTAATQWLHDLPFMPVTFSRKLYGFDTTYWTGWATSENDYLQPTLDWADAHKIIHRLKRA